MRLLLQATMGAPCTAQSLAYLLLLLILLPFCSSRDTLTVDKNISRGGDTLISAGQRFELGFFTPEGSPRTYVAIWYYGSLQRTVVWVANRDRPIKGNSSAWLAIAGGNLVLTDVGETKLWSRDSPNSTSTVARLMDSGNLVLMDKYWKIIWQSFLEPTDTFLPGMLMAPGNTILTSWVGPDNPDYGSFTFQSYQQANISEYAVNKIGVGPCWKSGFRGNFSQDDGALSAIVYFLSNFTTNPPQQSSSVPSSTIITSISESDYDNVRLVMNYTGKVQFFRRANQTAPWYSVWFEPRDNCSVFNACGNFASCSITNSNETVCSCLRGFKPVDQENWGSRDFSSGCTGKWPVCNTNGSKADNFLKFTITRVRAPDTRTSMDSKEHCQQNCLDNGSCQAYSFGKAQGGEIGSSVCRTWLGDLSDIQEAANGLDLYVRNICLPAIGGSSDKKRLWHVIAPLTAVTLIIAVCLMFYAWTKCNSIRGSRESIQENLEFHPYESEKRSKGWIDSRHFKEDDEMGVDVPFFDFNIIREATDNFSDENKLGQGGFGPVYKATFLGGQEIAVKRLLSGSGQGLKEFKNEVELIAKLQHRNLVNLVGYCIKGDEKMLLYEYMPNKSLDSFIFDRARSMFLTWDIRFEIILGIARGVLYLHQDSRLRIVHRDLKTSNILLDEEMDPKISDFGLARIFEAKQTEASTQRLIGTYGYMSPEYALDGFFSFKSDVFSFGVIILEIVSGKRSTGFYQSEGSLSLLTYAWKLWTNNKALDLVDQGMQGSYNRNEVLKCINVALLCVQEDPIDRPTIADVILRLSSEIAALPNPKEPAFAVKRRAYIADDSSSSSIPGLHVECSSTWEQGR